MAQNFTEWVGDDLKQAKDCLAAAQATPDDCEEAMKGFYGAMHNLKGLGGSFGYDLVTDIADSCCILLKKTETRNGHVLKVCQAHLGALDGIIAKDIKGDGGPTGVAIITQLRDTVGKTLDALEAA